MSFSPNIDKISSAPSGCPTYFAQDKRYDTAYWHYLVHSTHQIFIPRLHYFNLWWIAHRLGAQAEWNQHEDWGQQNRGECAPHMTSNKRLQLESRDPM